MCVLSVIFYSMTAEFALASGSFLPSGISGTTGNSGEFGHDAKVDAMLMHTDEPPHAPIPVSSVGSTPEAGFIETPVQESNGGKPDLGHQQA